ncbi:Hypothetical protein FKW44_003982 [Caligus rogercresseyi]|uniref:Uncharacterized protein n=1 Tax=Caligus rogercresseyi TaxID=217165 RepID=A0A7T8KAC0_CALRO|nr:Hypothetical protein FKW44_003982 [Caligus rogercresseyi]
MLVRGGMMSPEVLRGGNCSNAMHRSLFLSPIMSNTQKSLHFSSLESSLSSSPAVEEGSPFKKPLRKRRRSSGGGDSLQRPLGPRRKGRDSPLIGILFGAHAGL